MISSPAYGRAPIGGGPPGGPAYGANVRPELRALGVRCEAIGGGPPGGPAYGAN